MIVNQTVALGFLKTETKIEAQRFYACWLMDNETGAIMIDGSEKIIKYNKKKEEYWLQSSVGYFKELDTSSNNTKSFSFSFSSNIFIQEMDSLVTLEPISGFAIKIDFSVFEEPINPKTTLGFEILELYAEPMDTGYFVIPEIYKRVENE